MTHRQHDVVVIGAGLSGLRAAQLLAPDLDVCVIEARNRVGGRALMKVTYLRLSSTFNQWSDTKNATDLAFR